MATLKLATAPLEKDDLFVSERNPEETGPGEAERKEPPWLVLSLFSTIAVALLSLFGWSIHSHTTLLAELLIAAASMSAGGFLGFLFGMPRSGTRTSDPEDNNDREPSDYRPSNSLEQISDWLTKILIGVGLIELAKLRGYLGNFGSTVAQSLGHPPESATAIVTQLTIVVFLVVGFLASFLWTRLKYGGLQTSVDKNVRDLLRKQLAESKRELSEQKITTANLKSVTNAYRKGQIPTRAKEARRIEAKKPEVKITASEWPNEVREKLERFNQAPSDWDEDTAVEIFGKAQREADGKVFEADYLVDLNDAVVINLRVRTTGGEPLNGPVTFVLHPSFDEPVNEVKPKNDRAELKITVSEWLTVVAIVNNGDTVLSYNLKEVPGVPDWFRKGF